MQNVQEIVLKPAEHRNWASKSVSIEGKYTTYLYGVAISLAAVIITLNTFAHLIDTSLDTESS